MFGACNAGRVNDSPPEHTGPEVTTAIDPGGSTDAAKSPEVKDNELGQLIEDLRAPVEVIRGKAAAALGKLGPKAKGAVPALTAALKDPDPYVRGSAVIALHRIGEAHGAVAGLAVVLQDPEVCEAAAEVLADFGPRAAPALPALIAALRSPNDSLRVKCVRALAAIGPEAVAAVPALAGRLNDREEEVRYEAAWALCGIGPPAKEAFPALTGALSDQAAKVRVAAGSALASIDRDRADVAVPAMIAALRDKDRGVRGVAAIVLGKVHSGKESVPALVAALKDDVIYVREDAAEALGAFGPAAKEAVGALKLLFENRQIATARVAAAGALARCDADRAKDYIAVLIEALEGKNPMLQQRAVHALAELGPVAKQAVPALRLALKNEDRHIRERAAVGLGRIGAEAVEALDDLRKMEREEQFEDGRLSSAEAVRQIEKSKRRRGPRNE
jgi:HEAT repeat protein